MSAYPSITDISRVEVMAFFGLAVAFQESANDCAVTGSPLWNVQPSLSVIVQTFWSLVSIVSATALTILPVATSSWVSGVNSALFTLEPPELPGIRWDRK